MKAILVFITPYFQLFNYSEIFQNRKLGEKQKQTPNLAKQNNLSQVFKDTYLGKKTVKREGCDPRSRQEHGYLSLAAFSF